MAITILKQVMEEKLDANNVEVGLMHIEHSSVASWARPTRTKVHAPPKTHPHDAQVASIKMPPPKPDAPLTAACHYVPGSKNQPVFSTYNKVQLEEALARVAAAASS